MAAETKKKAARKRRRIKRAKITHISLVKRGANKMRATFKSFDEKDDTSLVFKTLLCKDELDEGLLTCVVYAAELEDHQKDIADPIVVKDMCHNFIARGGMIDLEHDLEPIGSDRVRLAENFIVHKGHPDFQNLKDDAGNHVDEEGAWAVKIMLLDSDLRAAVKSGDIGGVSMFGQAEFESESVAASDIDSVVEAVVKILNQEDEEDEMKPEEMAELMKANNKALAETIVTAIASAKKSDDDEGGDKKKTTSKAKEEEVEFEGDRSNPEDVQKHLKKLKEAKLDWNDEKAVAKHFEELEAEQKAAKKTKSKKSDDDDEDENAEEIAKLKKALAKLEGQSSQGEEREEEDDDESDTSAKSKGKDKKLEKLIKSGLRAVQDMNSARGFEVKKTA